MSVKGNCGGSALGRRGEDVAADELARRGYRIVARNVRLDCGELDIVARDGPSTVFVEVKSRRAAAGEAAAAEAVSPHKRLVLWRAARAYLSAHYPGLDAECRFDVVLVRFHGGGKPSSVTVIEDAF